MDRSNMLNNDISEIRKWLEKADDEELEKELMLAGESLTDCQTKYTLLREEAICRAKQIDDFNVQVNGSILALNQAHINSALPEGSITSIAYNTTRRSIFETDYKGFTRLHTFEKLLHDPYVEIQAERVTLEKIASVDNNRLYTFRIAQHAHLHVCCNEDTGLCHGYAEERCMKQDESAAKEEPPEVRVAETTGESEPVTIKNVKTYLMNRHHMAQAKANRMVKNQAALSIKDADPLRSDTVFAVEPFIFHNRYRAVKVGADKLTYIGYLLNDFSNTKHRFYMPQEPLIFKHYCIKLVVAVTEQAVVMGRETEVVVDLYGLTEDDWLIEEFEEGSIVVENPQYMKENLQRLERQVGEMLIRIDKLFQERIYFPVLRNRGNRIFTQGGELYIEEGVDSEETIHIIWYSLRFGLVTNLSPTCLGYDVHIEFSDHIKLKELLGLKYEEYMEMVLDLIRYSKWHDGNCLTMSKAGIAGFLAEYGNS